MYVYPANHGRSLPSPLQSNSTGIINQIKIDLQCLSIILLLQTFYKIGLNSYLNNLLLYTNILFACLLRISVNNPCLVYNNGNLAVSALIQLIFLMGYLQQSRLLSPVSGYAQR
jgi:hypothetical protein